MRWQVVRYIHKGRLSKYSVVAVRVYGSLFGTNILFYVSHFPLNNHRQTFACSVTKQLNIANAITF